MHYLVFKLNLQPAKLFEYKSEKSYLLNELIPTMLQRVVSLEKLPNKEIFKIELENKEDKNFKIHYNRILENTKQLLDYYNEILEHYNENGEIYYSKNFLSLNSRCGSQRRKFLRQYPVLERAYSLYTDEIIDKEIGITFESQIGTGITHLRKFYKMKKYIEEVGIELENPLDTSAYYRPSDEKILIKLDTTNELKSLQEANVYITYFENLINNNSKVVSQLGRVTINPVYESITLKEENYTEITFTLVYPNGNPSLDRHNILAKSEAKEAQITIYGSDERPLNKEAVESIVNEEGKKGYLKNISTTKGKKIWAIIKRTTIL